MKADYTALYHRPHLVHSLHYIETARRLLSFRSRATRDTTSLPLPSSTPSTATSPYLPLTTYCNILVNKRLTNLWMECNPHPTHATHKPYFATPNLLLHIIDIIVNTRHSHLMKIGFLTLNPFRWSFHETQAVIKAAKT